MPPPDRRAAPRTAPSTGSSGRVGPARLAGRPRLEPQSPQAHETSGVVVAERIGGLVGGQLVVVQPDRAPAAGDETAPGNLAPEPDLSGDPLLALADEGVQCPLQRREPQAVVDGLGPAWLEARLLVGQVALEGEILEIGVGHEQGQGSGALVDLAALDADPAVLDHVHPTPTVGADDPGHLPDQLVQRQPPAVDGDRKSLVEGEHHLDRLRRRRARQLEDLLRGLDPGVLQDAALDRTPPEILVDRVRAGLRHRDGNAEPLGVLDRLLAGEPPPPHRSQRLEIRGERARRHLEADLVVALAGTAVGDGVGPVLTGGGHHVPDDERTGERRHEWVLALVPGVRLQRRSHEVARELLTGVDHDRLHGAGGQRPLTEAVEVTALPDVGSKGDHLHPHLLPQPPHRHRRVQTAAVGQDHSLWHSHSSRRDRRAQRPARADRRRATSAPPARSEATTITVSSPATVPITPSMPDRSSADPTTWAEPGGVRSTTTFAECTTSTAQSASTRRRWSSGATWSLGSSGMA